MLEGKVPAGLHLRLHHLARELKHRHGFSVLCVPLVGSSASIPVLEAGKHSAGWTQHYELWLLLPHPIHQGHLVGGLEQVKGPVRKLVRLAYVSRQSLPQSMSSTSHGEAGWRKDLRHINLLFCQSHHYRILPILDSSSRRGRSRFQWVLRWAPP